MCGNMKKELTQEIQDFVAGLRNSIKTRSFIRLTLSDYHGQEQDLIKSTVRLVSIKGHGMLTFVNSYSTKDITVNYEVPRGLGMIGHTIQNNFSNAHLYTSTIDTHLTRTGDGPWSLLASKASATGEPEISAAHDRQKKRVIDQKQPFLHALGITDAEHKILPSMNDKWRQINRFMELFNDAAQDAGITEEGSLSIADFGSGKGYLTFAIHNAISSRSAPIEVTGIEIRDDLVKFCNDVSAELGCKGLAFRKGDITSYSPDRLDILIALHACDTATDHAISLGIKAGAKVIMCAPCCHKEIRPMIKPPEVIKSLLKHGIHLGQEAEMLTDTLRALLMEAAGYQAKVFEFISLEHTDKNKMILGIKRRHEPGRQEKCLAQIRALKDFYGITRIKLEELLADVLPKP